MTFVVVRVGVGVRVCGGGAATTQPELMLLHNCWTTYLFPPRVTLEPSAARLPNGEDITAI